MLRTLVMERFTGLIEARDSFTLRKWLGVVVDQYSKSEAAIKWDFEATVPLLKASLLREMVDANKLTVPSSCDQVLTQTEILQTILLPQAMIASTEGDDKKLELISSLSVHYLVEMERKIILPTVGVQCFVIALLWRIGEDAELSSFLSSRQSQWSIRRRRRQMNLPTTNRMYFDNPGAIAFAQMLFLIATDVSGSGEIYLEAIVT